MQMATSMMGKHHQNSNTKLTDSMKQDIAFSLDTDSRAAGWMEGPFSPEEGTLF